jgi:NAD+ kinase
MAHPNHNKGCTEREGDVFVPNEVLLVYKKSKFALYAQERKHERFQALLAREDELAQVFVQAHEAHQRTLEHVKSTLSRMGVRFRTCYRARLSDKDTQNRLVLTVGGDGTLLDASHRVSDAVVLGVNSDPARSVGFLCAATAENVERVLGDVLEGRLQATPVARLQGWVDDAPLGMQVLNEVLVAHRNPAATARYLLRVQERVEEQKSSGIWLAGPAGSTAAIASAGGYVQSLDDSRLQLRVREAYGADSSLPTFTQAFVSTPRCVEVVSRMREGVIYVDGPHKRIAFPMGATLRLGADGAPLSLVVTEEMHQRRARLGQELMERRSAGILEL